VLYPDSKIYLLEPVEAGNEGEDVATENEGEDVEAANEGEDLPVSEATPSCWVEVEPNPCRVDQWFTISVMFNNRTNHKILVDAVQVQRPDNEVQELPCVSKTQVPPHSTACVLRENEARETDGTYRIVPVCRTSEGEFTGPTYRLTVE
jgi:hypothetical protein